LSQRVTGGLTRRAFLSQRVTGGLTD